MEPIVKFSFPFRACTLCENISIETEAHNGVVYSDNVPYRPEPLMIVHYCRHEDICRNAVKVYEYGETKL